MTDETENKNVANAGEHEEEVQSNWVGWGKAGTDYVKGTLTRVFKTRSTMPGKQNEMITNYEMKLTEGTFHNVDKKTKVLIEPAIVVNPGDMYNIGGRPILERQLQNIKVGTKIRLVYKEDSPAKNAGFADLKVIKVLVVRDSNNQPVMDTDWLAQQENEKAVQQF